MRGRWKGIYFIMWCTKCNGRVFIDRVFSQKLHMELFCVMCGRRWMINKETNRLAKWLELREMQHEKSFFISS
jgi:hypothetical protein